MTVKKTVIAGTSAAVIAATVPVLAVWEGTDYVAKPDRIGTGHPITWCHGQTNADRDAAHQVRSGQRFTKEQCDAELATSLPPYLERIQKCIKVDLPVKTTAALLDAAYNAGSAAVCKSPMVARMNAGDIRGGCEAFRGWYIRSDGQVRTGLVARRSGLKNDSRVNERQLCLEGLDAPNKVVTKPAVIATVAVVAKKQSLWSRFRHWIFK